MLSLITFGQPESVGPVMTNPALHGKHPELLAAKVNAGTFDSTFVYTSDTIVLPIFDDFQ